MNIDKVVNFPYPTPPEIEQIKVGILYNNSEIYYIYSVGV